MLALCVGVFITNTITGGYGIYKTPILDSMLAPYEAEELTKVEDTAMRAFAILIGIFTTGAWIFPIGIYFLSCKYLLLVII